VTCSSNVSAGELKLSIVL